MKDNLSFSPAATAQLRELFGRMVDVNVGDLIGLAIAAGKWCAENPQHEAAAKTAQALQNVSLTLNLLPPFPGQEFFRHMAGHDPRGMNV